MVMCCCLLALSAEIMNEKSPLIIHRLRESIWNMHTSGNMTQTLKSLCSDNQIQGPELTVVVITGSKIFGVSYLALHL